jgi:hypothetical protein
MFTKWAKRTIENLLSSNKYRYRGKDLGSRVKKVPDPGSGTLTKSVFTKTETSMP